MVLIETHMTQKIKGRELLRELVLNVLDIKIEVLNIIEFYMLGWMFYEHGINKLLSQTFCKIKIKILQP